MSRLWAAAQHNQQVVSMEDGDDMRHGAVVDMSGVIRLKRGRTEVSAPPDPEAYRKRMRTLALAYVHARLRHPGRPALRTATVEVWAQHVEYMMGDHVRGLVARDCHNAIISRPTWPQVMHYDYQIRKEHARLMNMGKPFGEALLDARNDTSLRGRHFVTQVAVSVATGRPKEGGLEK